MKPLVMSCGSSPRLRGTLPVFVGPVVDVRFIPAPAGNARWPPSETGNLTGSSPRLRGTPAPSTRRPARRRFIPAPAGNAMEAVMTLIIRTVHPRACGERLRSPLLPHLNDGSSPRLRGTPTEIHAAGMVRRFIPAPAGNAPSGCNCSRPATVHPRACGERSWTAAIVGTATGSSPRLRGTRPSVILLLEVERFIPAPAGNA